MLGAQITGQLIRNEAEKSKTDLNNAEIESISVKIAQEAEVELKWKMESAKITVEIYRTESANNRNIDRAMQ